MSLESEINSARTEIVSDGYDMSVGEIINLYRDKEIIITPEFQRLFRWGASRKNRFIESLLLGIPIPPIFVYQNEDGIWELIDGLQRLSTVFEFVGILREGDDAIRRPSTLDGTTFLPSLAGKKWKPSDAEADDGLGQAQQLQIKRARLRVEILKQESDPKAKYELFQRLNTGGAELSEQEVRNCIAVMLNRPFFLWLKALSEDADFRITIDQTEYAVEKQMPAELTLRFLAFRNVPYRQGLDVHEYLDEALISLANNQDFDRAVEENVFKRTFSLLANAMNERAFKRWDGQGFKGKFLMSVFEVVAIGVSKNIDAISQLESPREFVEDRCKALWANDTFNQSSGAGVRGTTRLTNLLPISEAFFHP